MHVITALDEERQAKAEAPRELVGPWPERDDDVAGGKAAGIGRDHPARARRFEAPRVAPLHPTAALDEQGCIALDEGGRIGRRQRLGIMHAADRFFAHMRFEGDERGAVKDNRLDAEPLELLGLRVRQILSTRAAVGLDPAAGAQKA